MGILGTGVNTANVGVYERLKNPFTREVDPGESGREDFKDGFVITALDPTKGYEAIPNLKTQLTGNFMPHVPFTHGGNQRVKKDYYPGNNEASVQVLGAREADVTIKGRFYAKKFSRGDSTKQEDSPATIPDQLKVRLDNIRIQGFPVEISLGEWKRYAIISVTKWDMNRVSDQNYEITFSIFSINKPTRCPIIDSSKLVPVELISPLNDQLLALQDDAANRAVPDSVPASIGDIIGDATSLIASATSSVLSVFNDLVEAGEDISNTVNSTIGIIKNARAEIHRQKTRLAAISYSTSLAGLPVPDSASASSIMSSRQYISNDIINLMGDMIAQFLVISDSTPSIRHKVIEGQTLQIIANIYYGEFSRWVDIYNHNKLTSTELEAGKILEIPE